MGNAAAVVEIRPRKDWMGMINKVAEAHWYKLKVTIKFRDHLHAGKPAQLDAAKAMLKARGLEDAIEVVDVTNPAELENAAAEVVNEGLCEFSRRDGKPGIWTPANNLKAMCKENWSVLGYNMDARPKSETKDKESKALRGSRGGWAEGCFVVSCNPEDRDFIYLGEKPDGIDTGVSHTTGPKGPVSSIKRNEFVDKREISFEIWIAKAVKAKIPDESIADMLYHAGEHGTGANRSQGRGRFDLVKVEEI